MVKRMAAATPFDWAVARTRRAACSDAGPRSSGWLGGPALLPPERSGHRASPAHALSARTAPDHSRGRPAPRIRSTPFGNLCDMRGRGLTPGADTATPTGAASLASPHATGSDPGVAAAEDDGLEPDVRSVTVSREGIGVREAVRTGGTGAGAGAARPSGPSTAAPTPSGRGLRLRRPRPRPRPRPWTPRPPPDSPGTEPTGTASAPSGKSGRHSEPVTIPAWPR